MTPETILDVYAAAELTTRRDLWATALGQLASKPSTAELTVTYRSPSK